MLHYSTLQFSLNSHIKGLLTPKCPQQTQKHTQVQNETLHYSSKGEDNSLNTLRDRLSSGWVISKGKQSVLSANQCRIGQCGQIILCHLSSIEKCVVVEDLRKDGQHEKVNLPRNTVQVEIVKSVDTLQGCEWCQVECGDVGKFKGKEKKRERKEVTTAERGLVKLKETLKIERQIGGQRLQGIHLTYQIMKHYLGQRVKGKLRF